MSPFISEEAEAELEPLLDEQGLQADPSVPLTHAPWRAQDMAPGPSPCLAILSLRALGLGHLSHGVIPGRSPTPTCPPGPGEAEAVLAPLSCSSCRDCGQ